MKAALGHLLTVWALASPRSLSHVGTLVAFGLILRIHLGYRQGSGGEPGAPTPPTARATDPALCVPSAPPDQHNKEAR